VQTFADPKSIRAAGHGLRKEELNEGLRAAAKLGDAPRMEGLLKRGADANAADENGWSAVHEAVRKGSVPALTTLLDHGGKVDRRTNSGDMPRWLANSMHGSEHAVTRLLAARGAPNEHNSIEL